VQHGAAAEYNSENAIAGRRTSIPPTHLAALSLSLRRCQTKPRELGGRSSSARGPSDVLRKWRALVSLRTEGWAPPRHQEVDFVTQGGLPGNSGGNTSAGLLDTLAWIDACSIAPVLPLAGLSK
jgi:hypothetical protein